MEVGAAIENALRRGKRIWIRSHSLRDSGENALEQVVVRTFNYYGKEALGGAVHAAARELVQNASKAALKRIVFEDLGLDPLIAADYEKGIAVFRRYLVESQLSRYRRRFAERGLDFVIHLLHQPSHVVLMVMNRSPLLAHEEERVRRKFVLAGELDSLFDFYIKFGDNTEGAGMGIAMVEILLREAGVDEHNFTIFSDAVSGTTTAKIVVPLEPDYVTPRAAFSREMKRTGLDADALRARLRTGDFALGLPPAL